MSPHSGVEHQQEPSRPPVFGRHYFLGLLLLFLAPLLVAAQPVLVAPQLPLVQVLRVPSVRHPSKKMWDKKIMSLLQSDTTAAAHPAIFLAIRLPNNLQLKQCSYQKSNKVYDWL